MIRGLINRALAMVLKHEHGAVMRSGDTLVVLGAPRRMHRFDDSASALTDVATVLDGHHRTNAPSACEHPCDEFGIVWLTYDALRALESRTTVDERAAGDRVPAGMVAWHAAFLTVDLREGSVVAGGSDSDAAQSLLREWNERAELAHSDRTSLRLELGAEKSVFVRDVRTVQEHILDGDVYLLNLARVVSTPSRATDLDIAWSVLDSMAPRAGLLRYDNLTIGTMTMELALRWNRNTGAMQSQPIKGTRPRSVDSEEDQRLALELQNSEKERAENVMAVDVHRNDLGRVARPGTVHVPALWTIESHTYVHHLVSHVEATAPHDLSALDALESVLPVGSVTGAPKRSAMQIIARMEPTKRGLYTGVCGTMSPTGVLELSVMIRTLVSDVDGTHYGVGGGIVIDSDPETEWQELRWKLDAVRGIRRA